MSSAHRRILFALNEPGYFRMYGAAIVEMTRRGWDVDILFEKPERRGPDAPLPQGQGGTVRSLGGSPVRVSHRAASLRLALDYLRYLEPTFAGAGYLRRRVERHLPPAWRFLKDIRQLPRWVVSAAIALGRAVERLMPADAEALALLRRIKPDAVLVTPVVVIAEAGLRQTELIKAARALRIPVVIGIASWDHLTSKGLLRVVPDALTVWNETQVEEAHRLHRIPRRRVIVTGAQPLDHWFAPVAADAVQAFRRQLGVDATRRVLLFVGSSPNMAPGDSEVQFVRRWLSAIRASAHAGVREAYVIVRPHPGNGAPWQAVELDDPQAVIYPRRYDTFPLSDADIETFRCSLAASTAVIGVNTTAMIEAAIMRRPVFSVRAEAFQHSQEETLHFGYLADAANGFVQTAASLAAHVAQLERLVTEGPDLRRGDRFVERFVRPRGMGHAATMHLCDAIERVA